MNKENEENKDNEESKIVPKKKSRKKPIILTATVLLVIASAFATTLYIARTPKKGSPTPISTSYKTLPIDNVVSTMITRLDSSTFSIKTDENIVTVGNFVAKRVSTIDGRVRLNLNAIAKGNTELEQWETSILIEFNLIPDGTRLKANNVTIKRIHIYDLPKEYGSDELEYNESFVSFIKDLLQPSKEIVFNGQHIKEVKLTVDDNVRIITGENL